MPRLPIVLALLVLVVPLVGAGVSPLGPGETRFTADNGTNWDTLGQSVAVAPHRIVAGAPRHSADLGAVYVWERSGLGQPWTGTQLMASVPEYEAHFGWSVAMDGERIAVGAYGEDAVYIFDWTGSAWAETKIEPTGTVAYFGHDVDVDGDRLVVADGGSKVFVYERATSGTWNLVTTFSTPSWRAALSGDRILTSDPAWGVTLWERQGSGTWTSTGIYPSDAPDPSSFGRAIDIDGDRFIVGNDVAKAAYVYERDAAGNWIESKLLAPANSGTSSTNYYGRAVAVDGARVAVGAWTAHMNRGGVWTYEKDGAGAWTSREIRASDGKPSGGFGTEIALSGDYLGVGAALDDEKGNNAGAAYHLDLLASPEVCDGVDNDRDLLVDEGFPDNDADGAKDCVDPDDDNDGVADAIDAFPFDPAEWADNDRDGVGDNADPDDDNDGLSDSEEPAHGTDPKNPDTDGDRLSDGEEVATYGTNPLTADTDADGVDDRTEVTHAGCLDAKDDDSDDDGLTDGEELYTYRTNECLPDTDADTLLDGYEVRTSRTDPKRADTDADGLKDGAEIHTHGTDPRRADTDGDGLRDGAEVNAGTCLSALDPDSEDDGLKDGPEVNHHRSDPCRSDTDGDGLGDWDEVMTHRTDPTRADTDGDGLDDPDELARGTNPRSADTDGDRWGDGTEVRCGTNPRQPTSFPPPGGCGGLLPDRLLP